MAVIVFDVGGVLSEEPFERLERYAASRGLPAPALNGYFRGDPEFSAVEAGNMSVRDFLKRLPERCLADHGVEINARCVAEAVAASRTLRPEMLDLLRELRTEHTLGVLTNNVKENDDWLLANLPADTFAHVVNSAVVGLRKPDPAIYLHVLDLFSEHEGPVTYVDDFEENLPPAASVGMDTIHFTSPADLRAALEGRGLLVASAR